MNTTKFLLFFSVIFGLTTASPTFTAASAGRELSSPSLADDHRLCSAPGYVYYKYGNQTNQDRITAECEKLSQKLKTQADKQGNFTEVCGRPSWKLFGKEGDCALWLNCWKTTEGNAVTMGSGDVAHIIKLATDGLQGYSQADNSSIVGVDTAFSCQQVQAKWWVALDRSGSPAQSWGS